MKCSSFKWSLLETERGLKNAIARREDHDIRELSAIKEGVQKKITDRRAELQQHAIFAERRVELFTSAVEPVLVERERMGRGIPEAHYTNNELTRLENLAERTRDATLLRYVDAGG